MKAIAAIDWLRAILRLSGACRQPTLKQIYAQCHARTIAQGEVLYRQGEAADALHVILQGRFRNVGLHNGRFTEQGSGSAMGEFAFFTRVPHAETATAVRESVVLRLEWGEFEPMARGNPEIWQRRCLGLRRSVEARPAPRRRAPVRPAKDPRHRSRGGRRHSAQRFSPASPRRSTSAPIVSCSARKVWGRTWLAASPWTIPQAAHWLGEQEGRFDLVVALTGGHPSEWARKTITEADEVLLVGLHETSRAGTPVPLNPIEELALAMRGGEVLPPGAASRKGPEPAARGASTAPGDGLRAGRSVPIIM